KLSVLRRNSRLDLAAKIRAQSLLRQAQLNHGNPGPTLATILRQVGYRSSLSGELLAADYPTSVDTVSAWMSSTIHRTIISNRNYREMGAAVIHTPTGSPFRVISVVIVAKNSGL